MNSVNRVTTDTEQTQQDEKVRQPIDIATIGRAGLLWADPSLPQSKVAKVTGLTPRELRRLFGSKPTNDAQIN